MALDEKFASTVVFFNVEGKPVAYDVGGDWWCRRFDLPGYPRYNGAVAVKDGTVITEQEFRDMVAEFEKPNE